MGVSLLPDEIARRDVRRPPHRSRARRSRPRCSPRSATTSLDALVDAAVPAAIRERAPLALGGRAVGDGGAGRLRALGARNEVFTSLIGLGYSDTITPP